MAAAVAFPAGAREQMSRSVLRAAAFLRAAQLALWLWVPAVYGIGQFSSVVLIGYLLVVAWTGVLFTVGVHGNGLPIRWVIADVAVAVACAVIVSRFYPLGEAASPRNWVVGPICGAAVTCAFFASRWITAWSVAAIGVAWLVGAWPDIRSPSALSLFSDCAVIVVFALVAALAAGMLFRAAEQADQAASAALQAQRREAMAEARDEERRQQFKVLHDNVLHTLESIARGELGVGSEQARETCMRDADYLRGLITGGGADSIPTDLGVALAGMGRDRSALGLRINQQFDALPKVFPRHVAEALTGGAREALNNVVKHAGTAEAWLSAYGDGVGGVIVTVVDRGCGFDPDAQSPGLGLMRSVRHRVLEVGGKVRIDSAPGEGTSIEMSWTP
jgi:signal transduction histidine kinase